MATWFVPSKPDQQLPTLLPAPQLSPSSLNVETTSSAVAGVTVNPNLAEFAFSKSFEPTAATRCRKCVEKLASLVEADTRILILASLRDLT